MPDTMRNRLKLLLERQRTVDAIERVLDNEDHRHFGKVLDTVLDRGYGKPQQHIDLTSDGSPIPGVVILPPSEASSAIVGPPAPQLHAGDAVQEAEGGGGTPERTGGV